MDESNELHAYLSGNLTGELCGAAFRVRTSDLLGDNTVVKDDILTGSHGLIQFGQFLKAGH